MQSIDVFLHIPDTLFYDGEIKGLAMFFNPTLETQKSWINLPLYSTGLEDVTTIVHEEDEASSAVYHLNRDYSVDILMGKFYN